MSKSLPVIWSHHQKIVIVDEKTAFLGGLDLCYGRWDTSEHRLVDSCAGFHPYMDFSNARIADYTAEQIEGNNLFDDVLNRRTQHRLPWHDIQVKIQGPSVYDICLHFLAQWKHVSNNPTCHEEIDIQENNNFLSQSCKKAQIKQMTSSLGIKGLKKEAFNQDDESRNKSISFHGSLIPKFKPETNVNCDLYSEVLLARLADVNNDDDDLIFLENVRRSNTGESMMMQSSELPKLPESSDKSLRNSSLGNFRCQILRSASYWSLGLATPEKSIYAAYIELILKSEHFVYMENQFFISSICDLNGVKNEIGNVIVARIIRASVNKEQFKFYLVMPLSPGSPGDPWSPDSKAELTKVQTALENATVRSIFSELAKYGIKGENYFVVYGLRTSAVLPNGVPVTEQIYVHSKLLIVDDTKIIVGSANINDRSLLGHRDSEIAVLIEDTKASSVYFEKYKSISNVKKKGSQKSIHDPPRLNSKTAQEGAIFNFRQKLFKEHFQSDEKDIISEEFWASLKAQARKNTEIYREIFPMCYPDDKIRTMDDLKERILNPLKNGQVPSIEAYEKLKGEIKGQVVEYPMHFLENFADLNKHKKFDMLYN